MSSGVRTVVSPIATIDRAGRDPGLLGRAVVGHAVDRHAVDDRSSRCAGRSSTPRTPRGPDVDLVVRRAGADVVGRGRPPGRSGSRRPRSSPARSRSGSRRSPTPRSSCPTTSPSASTTAPPDWPGCTDAASWIMPVSVSALPPVSSVAVICWPSATTVPGAHRRRAAAPERVAHHEHVLVGRHVVVGVDGRQPGDTFDLHQRDVVGDRVADHVRAVGLAVAADLDLDLLGAARSRGGSSARGPCSR